MLYVSTRNTKDAYTAHRALHETFAPDGGYYVPFRLTTFSASELSEIKKQTPCETITQILNHFFGLHLGSWDVECAIGRSPYQAVSMNHRLIVAEVWRNPQGCWDYFLENLYSLMTENTINTKPDGWSRIAIGIALLFGLYSSSDFFPQEGLDVAVTASDFSDVISVLFAKDMGLPFNIVITSFNENGAVWDFINKGTLSAGATVIKTDLSELDIAIPKYLEYLLFRNLGPAEVLRYLEAVQHKANHYIDDEQLQKMNSELFAAVVSSKRVEYLQSSVYKTNQYHIDPHTALAYGGLQDYRARTGVSKETIILAKWRPNV